MSLQTVKFTCVGTADDESMKAQLSSIPGIVEMDIHSKTHNVDVRYEDTRISAIRIEGCLNNPNYKMELS